MSSLLFFDKKIKTIFINFSLLSKVLTLMISMNEFTISPTTSHGSFTSTYVGLSLKKTSFFFPFFSVLESLKEGKEISYNLLNCSSFILLTCVFNRGEIDDTHWRFLLTGGVALENPHPNPASYWFPDKSWAELVRLSEIPEFHGISNHFHSNVIRL